MFAGSYIAPLAAIGVLLLAVGLLFSFGPVIFGVAIALIVIPLGGAVLAALSGSGDSDSAEEARRREPGGKRWWEKSPHE
jgi:hypothetical protein